ncbi:MAG: acylphosphatase [Elusimicrobia bacterium]|nr:acylphosphatase [Elusimicrobiota bacterium]
MVSATCVKVIVSGYVQGIGYRYYVQRSAQAAGLTGWVRNLANGDVELEVAGDSSALETFLRHLKTVHPWARVEQVRVEAHDCPGTHQGFLIR